MSQWRCAFVHLHFKTLPSPLSAFKASADNFPSLPPFFSSPFVTSLPSSFAQEPQSKLLFKYFYFQCLTPLNLCQFLHGLDSFLLCICLLSLFFHSTFHTISLFSLCFIVLTPSPYTVCLLNITTCLDSPATSPFLS